MLSKPESRALNTLRGLPEDVHMMVMCSTIGPDGTILEGSEETLEELVEFIGEMLSEGMVSARDEAPLISLCLKIDPDCLDWLGS
ncbi:MAG: hypothetical protein AAFU79_14675 [Myxococcota bacterium]